jgi:hypothetical protein
VRVGVLVIVVIVALVAAPAAVFALVKASQPAVAPRAHRTMTAVSASGSAGAVTVEDVSAEKKALTSDVVRWKAHHPGGTCAIQSSSSAQCTTADGLPADLQVLAVTSTAP